MTEIDTPNTAGTSGLDRRTVMKGAAWSLPVVALAVATPAAAASTVDVGAFSIDGSCGTLGIGLFATGFDLVAGDTALPVGTQITLSSSGLVNIGVLTASGGTVSIAALGTTGATVTLTAALAPGATLALRTAINLSVFWSVNALVTLPTGYVGTGSKSTGAVSGTLVLCTES